MSDKRRLHNHKADPLASVLNHPEGRPYHSLISGLSGMVFATYTDLIKAEDTWGKQFGSKKIPSRTKKPVIDDGLNLTPAELL